MDRPGGTARAQVLAGGCLALFAVAGCGGDPPAAEPATAPPTSVAAAGTVIAIGRAPEGVVVDAEGRIAVAVRDPDRIAFAALDRNRGAATRVGTYPLAGAARHLSLAGPTGPLLVPLETSDSLAVLDLGRRTSVGRFSGVGSHPHDAAVTSTGRIAVTNEFGGGALFLTALPRATMRLPPAEAGPVPGPVQPGGAAAVGPWAVLADVRGHGLYVYDAARRALLAHADLGNRLTHLIALTPPGTPGSAPGVVAVADTTGGTVHLVRIAPQPEELATVDVPDRPYGLAYDATRQRLYVTRTGANLLRVVDVADPAHPHVLGDVPTVRQPNSIAVDAASGDLVVTGTDAGVLETIPASELPD